MNIQAPPNLSPGVYQRLIGAGLNDWGGVSPVTPDHVNPEAPWPAIDGAGARDRRGRQGAGRAPRRLSGLRARSPSSWLAPGCATHVRRMSDAEGLARDDDWAPGDDRAAAARRRSLLGDVDPRRSCASSIARPAARGSTEPEIDAPVRGARRRLSRMSAAPPMRCARPVSGDVVRYVVNRNINYTNVCYFRCRFCAFSKGKTHESLRGQPYDLALEEIVAPRRRGLGARRDRSLPAGRHPSRLHRRDLSRDLPRHQGRRCRACTSMPSRRSRSTQGAATLGRPHRHVSSPS